MEGGMKKARARFPAGTFSNRKSAAHFPEGNRAGNVPPTFSKGERGPFPHVAEIGRFDRRSKAQAAVEFLTTYAWAILVIAIVLAALIWLGVFNPMGRVSERCYLGPGLECEDFSMIVETEGFPFHRAHISTLRIRNLMPERIAICDVVCTRGSLPFVYPDGFEPGADVEKCITNAGLGLRSQFFEPGESKLFYGAGDIGTCFDENNQVITEAGKPGSRFKSALYTFYVKEGDSGLARSRVMKGEIEAVLIPHEG